MILTFFPSGDSMRAEMTSMDPLGQLVSQIPQPVQRCWLFWSCGIMISPLNRSYIFNVFRFSGYCWVTMARGLKKY